MDDSTEDALSQRMMQLKCEQHGQAVVIAVSGEVDTLTSPRLMALINDTATQQSEPRLVLDLTAVEFLGSAGIAAVTGAASVSNGQLRVVIVSRTIARSLHITGIDNLVEIHDTLDDALRAVQA
ncbi:anti-sigma factor antagonist [Pseudonocardia sp. TRM90224]|uniref:anti-sigma factor antagonist n=1 Tax=Pseudonocardia sp. TRM90224 TaxID=2812678 RepID=UPI001E34C099|nr:anti-sigma factor antagonist [Pseudonocardia sp. TRM90224]